MDSLLSTTPIMAAVIPALVPALNASNSSKVLPPMMPPCALEAPHSKVFLQNVPLATTILIWIMALIMLASLAIYIEEIVFIIRTFKIALRRKKTIWVLTFFPMFSVCCFIGLIVPRAGVFCHMVANLYFSTCLYQIMRLIFDYMGGAKKMFTIVEKGRHFRMNTLPICCCFVCLPRPPFNRLNLFKLSMVVLQIAIVRPVVLFLAAVLYMDKTYITGNPSLRSPFIWIMIIHLISTCTAVYGIVMISRALEPELEKLFSIRGKFLSIQGTLILTVVPNIIISGLIVTGRIRCNPLMPAKTVGEGIYYGILVLMMLPFQLVGRYFFHRAEDGERYAEAPQAPDALDGGVLTANGAATLDETKLLNYDDNHNNSDEKKASELRDDAKETKMASAPLIVGSAPSYVGVEGGQRFLVADEGESIV